jgi:hypothetical protein
MPASKQLVLPFTAQSKNRTEPLTSEAEAAAIFAFSELERKNGGLTNKPEKTVYITKVGYPLWFIVRGDFTYVFDGLNRSSYIWDYYEASQSEFMIEDFERNFKIREEYVKFLVNYQKSFQQSLNKKELACEGLIANSEFLGEIDVYRKEAMEGYSQLSSLGLLAPALKETEATAVVNQIETTQSAFKEKTEKIKQLTQLISKTTEDYIEGLQFEANAVTEETEAKIKAQKEIINPKIEKLTDEYKKQVDRLEKSIEREQTPLEKQKIRLEKTVKTAQTKIEQYKRQEKTQANKHNKRSEESLKKKIKKEKQELDGLEKQLKSVEKQLKVLADQKTNESFRLKREFDEKIEVERQPIRSLEEVRNDKLEGYRQENQKLEKLTKPVVEELDRLVKQRENILTNTPILGLKSDPKLKNNALLYVPFYVAAFNGAESGFKRYFVVSPVLVDSLGFSVKLKAALGRTKIKELIKPRFKVTTVLAEKIRLTAASSSEFEAQMEASAQKNNILNPDTPVKKGLLLLKEEGWLSEAEYQNLVSAHKAT